MANTVMLRRGDVLMTEGGDIDKLGRGARWGGSVSPMLHQNHVFAVRPGDDLDTAFLVYWLEARVARDYFLTTARRSTNLASTNKWTVGNLPLPHTPIDEQRAIADFLDRETARIDTLIKEQQRLVELLRRRRSAIRTERALRGTRATETVASILPWADQLPADWEVVPLTSVARLESGHTPSRTREDWWQDCYIPWISLNDVGAMRESKYLECTTHQLSDEGIANSSARLLPSDTVVLSRDATVGRTSIMRIPMATSQHFAAWICGPRLDPEYLWTLFTDAMQPYFASFQNGSTIRTIGMDDLKAFRIPLPPLDEQRLIVAHLDTQTAKIDTLIAETEKFIELSRERRSELITAAVTGQIDIRQEVA
ncbi:MULTISPECIES: restriction endonuclease subunit S [unclassified Mycolicibacterium]|nr:MULTISPECIES: restriction endonuclease subunit S [unclassified Mycolicibacterium]MUM28919.1 restriction endonuclease subunit S [Mycolicibacterium sp. CBMA 295]MUL81554.1 restriction endonuclease subunit S [Mycolicibacterium sp. CBMA 329]MUL87320.1 restriction endonuclease subunit S [Mycolicibacterium sp. CBMA 331]MUM02607.1 restriction endonuclease subunit S [Mycolicibacterium sp. CBMA 334]MUM37617.1 restriction endonuclease subunit S [Mycolicibacterium sp. CBMA 247]